MAFDWTTAALGQDQYQATDWSRVKRGKLCPICQKPDWCLIADDGSKAICMRTPGGEREIDMPHGVGYLHHVGEVVQGAGTLNVLPGGAKMQFVSEIKRQSFYDWLNIFDDIRGDTTDEDFERLAGLLGITSDALDQADFAYCRSREAWAIPMRDHLGEICGLRYRSEDGRKWAHRGSQSGLFWPHSIGNQDRGTWYIAEGPTDVAALLQLGLPAIGKPSATGGLQDLRQLIYEGRLRDVVIVADSDIPGKQGAEKTAAAIMSACRTVKIVTAMPFKDIREGVASGRITKEVLDIRIEQANYVTHLSR